MSEARLRALTGRRFPRRPAVLEGFARVQPEGGYPFIVPRAQCRVEGLLIEDVDAASLRALDSYEDEGRLYLRQPVEVIVDGQRVACQTYVGSAEARRR